MRHSEKIPQIPEKFHSYSLRVTFRVGISGVPSVCFKGKNNLECIWIYVTDIISRQHFGDKKCCQDEIYNSCTPFQLFMPPKELWEAYSNRTVRPSIRPCVRPAIVSSPYLLYSLR